MKNNRPKTAQLQAHLKNTDKTFAAIKMLKGEYILRIGMNKSGLISNDDLGYLQAYFETVKTLDPDLFIRINGGNEVGNEVGNKVGNSGLLSDLHYLVKTELRIRNRDDVQRGDLHHNPVEVTTRIKKSFGDVLKRMDVIVKEDHEKTNELLAGALKEMPDFYSKVAAMANSRMNRLEKQKRIENVLADEFENLLDFDDSNKQKRISRDDCNEMAGSIIDRMQERKMTRTTFLDYIRNFLDNFLGTNYVLESSKSQRENVDNLVKQEVGKFAEKHSKKADNFLQR